ncbi:MAG: ribonuclease Y [Candidatus Doudnabacteria bacterium RIFCSPHIGHO2_01_FULL_43_23]|uniref:Ribonuclease Y n=1 Tax=Candidatus Doudnabacteria bacterium RIFCSPHIGHO2_01_FULL_43_23 TaxID=1817822 RepID=A0A1F5NSD6_9BACT|nr:MAG: ribonuclease Y [Candidatus Doudnabacteria bacterium RIFCSPHIGHO2_01_FULL_43_23]
MSGIFIFVAIGSLVGIGLGYLLRKIQASYQIESAEGRLQKMLADAKSQEKEMLLSAKQKAMEITETAKKQENEFRNQIIKVEQRLEKKEGDLEKKFEDLDQKRQQLAEKIEDVKKKEEETEEIKQKQVKKLEEVAGMDRERAKTVLIEAVEKSVSEDLADLTRKRQAEARLQADKTAREIVADAIQRCSAEVATETTTTYVQLPSEEMKGRIIGKEGRNIKAFEQMMGVEVIVDDTPDTVVISGFNSIRRQIAKLTLEKLIKDGRIHPAKIEDAQKKAKEEINKSIAEAGEQAVYELGITNFPDKLVFLIGRLKYRSSYGQNMLKHSIEMAHIAVLIAKSLGADVNIVKQGAILHDIGKALDQDMEGTHVEIGRAIAEKFNLDKRVINAIESHHHDTDVGEKSEAAQSIEAIIVDAADNISGARPGARRESFDQYIKRLEELENLANTFPGVEKTYAIQGGREVRVFVRPKDLDDWGAIKLAKDLAGRIQNELKYPGEIKVHVIRETRAVEYAR